MKLVVVGGGSAGRTASIEAAELGADVTLIETDKIGGKCLNQGCMVVCGLNDVVKHVKTNQRFKEFGIADSNPNINFEKVAEGIRNTTGKIRGIITHETEKAGVTMVMGTAEIEEGFVRVDETDYPYDKLLIATGSSAFIPDLKGREYAKTYRDMLDYTEVPEKLIIVGSGTIATEIAGIFSGLGSKVHMLCRRTFLREVDEDIKNYIADILLKDVEIHENIDVEEIHEDGVTTKEGKMRGDVFLAVGMIPNSQAVSGLVDTGKRGEIIVNEKMETSHEDIYAAGDVVGGIGTTPVARMEGVVAARNACGIDSKVDYRYIPSSISLRHDVSYINTEQKGVEGHIPGSAGPGAFWDVLDRETGMTKMSVDLETGDITSVSSISPSARTVLAYMSKFMRDGYKIHDFENFVETHPSTDAVYKLTRFFAGHE
jgi:dihydrolipoamide dehydrogenase